MAGLFDTPRAGRQVWTVSALLLAVSDALAARFAAVSVRGELSGFTRAASGHCYFTLKDASGASAGLRCAMFRRAALQLDWAPRDGQQVDLSGRLTVYEARGELQMVVESLQRVGAGTLYEEFLRLKASLQAQGLFDDQRKRSLPPFVRSIALVTSATGAAVHDVLTALQRRAPHVAVVLCPSVVQGVDAPAALVSALRAANQHSGADLVLLCRGGGSLEDLWAFNDERVVRAVVASALPVICGVGHESDVTLADLAADLRAATPTAAAELAVQPRAQWLADLQSRADLMSRRVRQRLDGAAQRVDTAGLRLRGPVQVLARQSGRLALLGQRRDAALARHLRALDQAQQAAAGRLVRALQSRVERHGVALAAHAARLQALDPRQVLARGYAWIEDAAGRPQLRAQGLQPGQVLRAVWADGSARTEVQSIELDALAPTPGADPMGVPTITPD
jgi:exodeoxyribonuclease VII large subunit